MDILEQSISAYFKLLHWYFMIWIFCIFGKTSLVRMLMAMVGYDCTSGPFHLRLFARNWDEMENYSCCNSFCGSQNAANFYICHDSKACCVICKVLWQSYDWNLNKRKVKIRSNLDCDGRIVNEIVCRIQWMLSALVWLWLSCGICFTKSLQAHNPNNVKIIALKN